MNQRSISEANKLFRQGAYHEAIKEYIKLKNSNNEFKKICYFNIGHCIKKINQKTPNLEEKVTITLTTIKNRISNLDKVIDSLLSQKITPEKIIINISEAPFLIDEGIAKSNKEINHLKTNSIIKINWTDNTGPYRKIIPYLSEHFKGKKKQERKFITVDDDTIYPEDFIEKLLFYINKEKCVVAYRGRKISFSEKEIEPYESWQLGEPSKSFSNMPTGKDGVIYSTDFFNETILDMDIALKIAPTADDLWIKWHCALNGVKSIILNPDASTSDYKSFPVVDYSDTYRNVSLYKKYNGKNAENKNMISIKKLEEIYKKSYGYNLLDVLNSVEQEYLE